MKQVAGRRISSDAPGRLEGPYEPAVLPRQSILGTWNTVRSMLLGSYCYFKVQDICADCGRRGEIVPTSLLV